MALQRVHAFVAHRAGIMAGFSSALLTRKAFLSGSARVGRSTNGAKTFALFKKAEKQANKIAAPAKQQAKKAQSKVGHDSQIGTVLCSLIQQLGKVQLADSLLAEQRTMRCRC